MRSHFVPKMSKDIHVATCCSTALCCLTLVVCLISGPVIYSQINDIWLELDNEISRFRLTSDTIWKEMISIGNGGPKARRQAGYGTIGEFVQATSGQDPFTAQWQAERDYPQGVEETSAGRNNGAPGSWDENCKQWTMTNKGRQCKCNCERAKKCPGGQPGPKGTRGMPGADGDAGRPGQPGIPGDDARAQYMKYKDCIVCPSCGEGPTGPQGPEGAQGLVGSPGRSGAPGSDGQPGPPGERGLPGNAGKIGPPGPKGKEGNVVNVVVYKKGNKGPQGLVGPAGDKGPAGDDAKPGLPGPIGIAGVQGISGPRGTPGQPGALGLPGNPGPDSLYCPCPARSVEYSNSLKSRPSLRPQHSHAYSTEESYSPPYAKKKAA